MYNSSRQFNNGESPIVFRVIYRGQRKDVFTGISCLPQYWMKEEQIVSLRFSATNEINHQLHKMLANAEFIFQKLKFKEEEFILDDLIQLFIIMR